MKENWRKKLIEFPFLSTLSLLVLVKEMECFSLSRKLYCSYCLPGKHMRIIFIFTSLVLQLVMHFVLCCCPGGGSDSCLWKSFWSEIYDGWLESLLHTMEVVCHAEHLTHILWDPSNYEDDSHSGKI